MEVDLHSAASSVDSRHSSPFQMAASSMPPTTFPTQMVDRKRRRSLQSFAGHHGPSIEYANTQSYVVDRENDEERAAPAKRRNVAQANGRAEAIHQYSALGPAYDSSSNAFGADFTVDSPMHSLSLASPSPPPEIAGRSGQVDVDMGEGDNSTTAASLQSKTTFIPRQVKQTSLLRSTVPLVPSPLYHSHRFQSSSAASNSSGGQPTSSQSTSTEESIARKSLITTASDAQSSSCNSPASSQAADAAASSNRTNTPHSSIKFRESPLHFARTPSPSPLPISPSSDQDDGRKLHYSPGLAQSAFPGGKHMLRYTMGYREDCVSCQSKTPGHYGHVLHR